MPHFDLGHAAGLRPFRPDDAADLVAAANDPVVSRYLRDVFPYPYTDLDALRWLAMSCAQPVVRNFAITWEDRAVGGIGLVPQGDVHRFSAELGYWIGTGYWGRGLASRAVEAVTPYGFETLRLKRVFAYVFVGNTASMRVLAKNGYKIEGMLQQAVYKNGEFRDMYIYARINETWQLPTAVG